MPFVKKKLNGDICAIAKEQIDESYIYLKPSSPELQCYIQEEIMVLNQDSTLDALIDSDKSIARVTEDLINLLISKHVILFTELPKAVRDKLLEREKLRAEHTNSNFVAIMDDDDSL